MLKMDFTTVKIVTADNDTDNCVYYNTTTRKIILDSYNGIPQNLILNFIAWMILMVLFTILRKRAGNYGRIALVQRPDDNLKWRELFYGHVDEMHGASTSDDRSISSVESYHDKGALSWVAAIFRISEEQITTKCGRDATQYLSFQKHIIFFMIIMMITSIVIVLPSNFQGHLEGDENNFGHTTVNNLEPGSNLLWIHVTLSILYLPLAVILMRRFSVRARIYETESLSTCTLMITHIPRKRCDPNDIKQHLMEAYPEIQVKDVTIAFDASHTIRLGKMVEKMHYARDYAVKHLQKTGQRLQMRPYRCAYVCSGCTCNCPEVDAIDFYTRECQRLDRQRAQAREIAKRRPLGIAFVTCETEEDARALFVDLRRGWHCGAPTQHSSLSSTLMVYKWQASFAPLTPDILWENLSHSRNWYLKAISINVVLFLVLFFLTTPAIVVNLVNTPIFSDALEKSFSPVISQFVPTLILWTVAALLPVLVSYSDQWLCHWTRSEKNYSIMVKTFVFLLFMVLILPSIGLTSAKAFIDWTWNLKNETFRWKCLFLPDKGAFFVNYVATSTFIGTSLELIRFPELFVYAVRMCLIRSRAETSSVRKDILWEFPFGVQYAWMLLIFAMTTVYSLSCPLITPFGLLYMILKHGVDKHNLYFVYSPSKINSEIHSLAIHCVMFSVLLVQASFLALQVLRSGLDTAIACYALAGFVFSITSFLFSVFFSCCKGFSPISYVRTSDDSTPGSPGHVSSSTWFVPDVLTEMNDPNGSGDLEPEMDDVTVLPSVLYQNSTAVIG